MNPIDAIPPRVTLWEFRPAGVSGVYAARLSIEPAVGDPYDVRVLIWPGPPKQIELESKERLSLHQLAHYGQWIGTIATQLLRDHGVRFDDPGITAHTTGDPPC